MFALLFVLITMFVYTPISVIDIPVVVPPLLTQPRWDGTSDTEIKVPDVENPVLSGFKERVPVSPGVH